MKLRILQRVFRRDLSEFKHLGSYSDIYKASEAFLTFSL